jgi:hypothetical protein
MRTPAMRSARVAQALRQQQLDFATWTAQQQELYKKQYRDAPAVRV